MFPHRNTASASKQAGVVGVGPLRGGASPAPPSQNESDRVSSPALLVNKNQSNLGRSQVEMFFPHLLLGADVGGDVAGEGEEEDSDWEEEEAMGVSGSKHGRLRRASSQSDFEDHQRAMNAERGGHDDDEDDDDEYREEDGHDHDDDDDDEDIFAQHHAIGNESDSMDHHHHHASHTSTSSINASDVSGGATHSLLGGNPAAAAAAASSSMAAASKTTNFAARTRNTFLKIGGFVKRELNKARKSGGVSKRKFARVLARKKQVQELNNVRCIQRLEAHVGAIWCLEFSSAPSALCATGGADGIVRIWQASSALPPGEEEKAAAMMMSGGGEEEGEDCPTVAGVQVLPLPLLHSTPLRTYNGHTGDVLALTWSRSHFLATCSVDKTVRVWYPPGQALTSLCVLKHADFVTGVDFYPGDDAILLTACFDKQVRLWDVGLGACLQRVQTPSFITACKFNLTGDYATVGLYTGHCVLYQMSSPSSNTASAAMSMRYFTQIECRNKTGLQKKGRKVTRIRFMNLGVQEHMLITTNESRSRLYKMDDFSLQCKYRGSLNSMLQIGASWSEDGRHIICGSEDRHVVLWRTKNDLVKTIFGRQGRKALCDTYESFRATDSGPVTVAQFAPDHLVAQQRSNSNKRALAQNVPPPASITRQPVPANEASQHSTASTSNHLATAASAEDEVLQADDTVGLRGAIILTCGFDGIVGIFENN